MKRFIALVMMVCCALLAFGCGGGGNKEAKPTFMDVKAEDMLNDYIRDISIAQNKYKGQNVQITGQLKSKGQFNNSSNFYAVLLTKYALGRQYTILVEYPVDKNDEINKLKYNDFVVAKGECVGVVPQKDPTEISVQIMHGKIASSESQQKTNTDVSVGTNTSSATQAPPVPINYDRIGVITGTEVRIRSNPSMTGSILGHFQKGENVKIIEVTEKWVKVERNNGQIGWVSIDFCALK